MTMAPQKKKKLRRWGEEKRPQSKKMHTNEQKSPKIHPKKQTKTKNGQKCTTGILTLSKIRKIQS